MSRPFISFLMMIGVMNFGSAGAADNDRVLKEMMIQNLNTVSQVLSDQYAPSEWKRSYAGWDLDSQVAQAKAKVAASERISIREFQRILRELLRSTKDYHVNVQFNATARSTLPFTIMGAGGKYYFTSIDREKLPEGSFPFYPGDEVVEFDGRPISTVVQELLIENGTSNTPETDQLMAEIQLTSRSAAVGQFAPSGPLTFSVRRQGEIVPTSYQTVWIYTPELILDGPFSGIGGLLAANSKSRVSEKLDIHDSMRISAPLAENPATASPFALEARKSYIPALGPKLWETDESNEFDAYVTITAERKLVGYIRIPGYLPFDTAKAVRDFAEIISHLQRVTDVLVIDQINNPGGSVFYLYTLASMLTDQALFTPQHQVALSQSLVETAVNLIQVLRDVKTDQDAKKVLGNLFRDAYPVSFEMSQLLLNYARFIVAEWNAGKRITRPTYIWGVDRINPAPVRYTKPILIVTNALDFSGGDFFPAIMQDNKRAVIFGSRTAGAGGYVKEVRFPNLLGVDSFTVTSSIALRVDQNPIENIGVIPDVNYVVSQEDLQGGFARYAEAILKAATGMVR